MSKLTPSRIAVAFNSKFAELTKFVSENTTNKSQRSVVRDYIKKLNIARDADELVLISSCYEKFIELSPKIEEHDTKFFMHYKGDMGDFKEHIETMMEILEDIYENNLSDQQREYVWATLEIMLKMSFDFKDHM